jgi:ATP-dependent DNA helicase RecG
MQLTKSLLHTTDAYIKRLSEAGIESVTDLLSYFPRDIEDKSDMCERFSEVNITEKQVIKCTLELITSEMTRNKKLLIKAVLVDRDGSYAEAIWFNRKFLLQQFASGDTVIIYGKAKYEYGRLTFPSCEIEHFKATRREIVPVYSDLNYIPGIWIREKIALLRSYLVQNFDDTIPLEIRTKHGFRTRRENITSVHFPTSIEDFERSRTELGYEELYHFQKRGLEKKYALERE